MRSWQDFDIVGTVQVALFLFSSTFTPLSVYHAAPLRWLISASPLYQSVALVRAITLGRPDLAMVGHLGYLTVMAGGALWLASRRMNRLLLK
jgi:lipooligosaccharide transport system permease protein